MHYLLDHYGQEAFREVLKNTAQKVYKTIHEGLKNGVPDELAEFWTYYLEREKGEFSLEKAENELRLTVKDCPALRHLVKLDGKTDLVLCEATKVFNEALAEGTPYELTTERTGEFSCVQTLKKRGAEQ